MVVGSGFVLPEMEARPKAKDKALTEADSAHVRLIRVATTQQRGRSMVVEKCSLAPLDLTTGWGSPSKCC